MGYQPLPKRQSKQKSQPKDERPPLQGYGDQLEGSTGEASPFPVYYRSPVVPPSGPGGIVPSPELLEKRAQVMRMQQAGLEYSEYYMAPVAQLAEELGIPPRPRVDPDLIGDYYQ